jgi:hypothetical protein
MFMPATTADRVWLAVTMLVCGAVSVACALLSPIPFFNDAMIYMSLGEHLAAGDGYRSSMHMFHDYIQPPFFPMLLAAFSKILGPLYAAIAVTALAWAATVPALVAIHRMIWGDRGWRFLAAAAAVSPILALSGVLVTEPLFACLTAWAIAFGFAAARTEKTVRYGVAAGLLCALSILTRPEGILTAAVLAVVLVLSRARGKNRFVAVGAAACVLAVVLVPYGFFVQKEIGTFSIVPKLRYNTPYADVLNHFDWPADQRDMAQRDMRPGYALMPDHLTFVFAYAFTHPEFDARAVFPRGNANGAGVRVKDAAGAARLIAWASLRAFGFWNPLALLFAGAALSRLRKNAADPPDRGLLATLVLFIGAFLVPTLSSKLNFEFRFLTNSATLSLLFISGGFAPVMDWVSRRAARVGPFVPAVLAASYVCFMPSALAYAAGFPPARKRIREIGDVCKRTLPAHAKVLDHNARCTFLVGGSFAAMPYVTSQAELDDYIRLQGLEYAVFDEDTMVKNPSPIIRGLNDPARWPSSWTEIATVHADAGTTTRIVKFNVPAQAAQ